MNNRTSTPIQLINCMSVSADTVLNLPFYTFLYLMQGSVAISIGGEASDYQECDVLLLPAGSRATLSAAHDCSLLLIGLSSDYVQGHLGLSILPVCNSVLNPDPDYLQIRQHLLDIYEESRSRGRSDLALQGHLYLLLDALRRLPGSVARSRANDRYAQRVQDIVNYIDAHYQEPLSLSDLAREFYLAPQYLSTFFKENLETNFKSYLNDKRLFYSLRDLRQTDLPIHEVAIRNGFASVSAYRKNFESRYHMTPSSFRQRHREQGSLQGMPGSIPLPEITQADRIAAFQSRVSIDTTHTLCTLTRTGQIVNVGNASNLLSASYRERLTTFVHENNIAYVRIQGILSSAFIPMLLPDYDYYFRNATNVVSYLENLGVVPIVELSHGQSAFPISSSIDTDTRYSSRGGRFYRTLSALLQHLYTHWSMTWLRQWQFELWMQPSETLESYAADLQRVRETLHQYLPGVALGGPGYHKCTTPVRADALMQYLRQQNIAIDYFSAYLDLRDLAADGKSIVLSKDPDYLIRTCQELRSDLSRYLPGTRFYVTEWSSMYLPGIPVAYSRYQAAFMARNILGLGRLCDLYGYWLFSDYAFRHNALLQEDNAFMDGQGLYTNTLLPTAAFYAYQLCSNLGATILDAGTNHCLVRESEGRYQLLAWHYVHPRSTRSAQCSSAKDFDKVYTLFPDTSAIYLHFDLEQMEPGNYRIRRFVIDEASGNLLDILIGELEHSAMSREAFLQEVRTLNPKERAYYESAFVPEMRKIYARVEHTLHLEAYMVPHCVCLWDIQRQL